MSARFIKKVYNDENGVRRLGFYEPATPKNLPMVTFDLNALEDIKFNEGEVQVTIRIKTILEAVLEGALTPEELEYAVEGI